MSKWADRRSERVDSESGGEESREEARWLEERVEVWARMMSVKYWQTCRWSLSAVELQTWTARR